MNLSNLQALKHDNHVSSQSSYTISDDLQLLLGSRAQIMCVRARVRAHVRGRARVRAHVHV